MSLRVKAVFQVVISFFNITTCPRNIHQRLHNLRNSISAVCIAAWHWDLDLMKWRASLQMQMSWHKCNLQHPLLPKFPQQSNRDHTLTCRTGLGSTKLQLYSHLDKGCDGTAGKMLFLLLFLFFKEAVLNLAGIELISFIRAHMVPPGGKGFSVSHCPDSEQAGGAQGAGGAPLGRWPGWTPACQWQAVNQSLILLCLHYSFCCFY